MIEIRYWIEEHKKQIITFLGLILGITLGFLIYYCIHYNEISKEKRTVGRRIEGDINGKLFFQPFSH